MIRADNGFDTAFARFINKASIFVCAKAYWLVGVALTIITIFYMMGHWNDLYVYDKSLVAGSAGGYWSHRGDGYVILSLIGAVFSSLVNLDILGFALNLMHLACLVLLPLTPLVAVACAKFCASTNFKSRAVVFGALGIFSLIGYLCFYLNGIYSVATLMIYIGLVFLATDLILTFIRSLLLVLFDENAEE